MAPANTGNDNKSKTAVIKILHIIKDKWKIFIPLGDIFKMVTIKLMEERILLILAKCRLKIAKSIWILGCLKIEDRGG